MAESVKLSKAPIVTNQIECHPYINQDVVITAAKTAGMSITGYYGMADGKVFNDATLKDIGARYGKSVGEARAVENFAIFDLALSADEMAAIHALAVPVGRIVSPDGLAPVWDKAS